jgi:hypothetical protein
MKTIAVVSTDYETPYPDPLDAAAGTRLLMLRVDDEFPGWIWCEATAGAAAWVPEQFLLREGQYGRLLRDYNAAELSIRRGETLTLGEMVNGWVMAVNAAGKAGWVPLNCLQVKEAA